MNIPKHAALAAAIALSFVAGAATAQTPAPERGDPVGDRTDARELATARAALARAAARVAELSVPRAEEIEAMRLARHFESRPVLGVLLAPDAKTGVGIAGVTPGSGAAKAGLKAGDRIVSVDGRQVLGNSGELRVRNLRKLLGGLEADKPTRIGYVRDGRTAMADVTPRAGRGLHVFSADGFDFDPAAFDFNLDEMQAATAAMREELIRIGPRGVCTGEDCRMPALLSAFRWNGLNLATVDKQLGRYFGTDHGVLVLSNGELAGLQAGDVIQRIDGKAVASPREAMAAMGDKPGGAKVTVDYLRDRKAGKVQVTVPKLAPLPLPPAPPTPPAPPKPPKAPPAPPTPPAPQAMAPTAPVAPAPPAPPLVPAGVGILA